MCGCKKCHSLQWNIFPDEITLVCLGPLTNLALAIKLDPSIKNKLKQIVMMGGNIYGRSVKPCYLFYALLTYFYVHTVATGNVLAFVTAEYNFYKDPEAAHIVLEEMKSPIKLIPWECYFTHTLDKVCS